MWEDEVAIVCQEGGYLNAHLDSVCSVLVERCRKRLARQVCVLAGVEWDAEGHLDLEVGDDRWQGSKNNAVASRRD